MENTNYVSYLITNRIKLMETFKECFYLPNYVIVEDDDYLFLISQLHLYQINPYNEYCCSPTVLKLHIIKTCIENYTNSFLFKSINDRFNV